MAKADERPPGDEHEITPEEVDEDPPRPPKEAECWSFLLTRPTERVSDVRAGTPVTGTPRRPDIVVMTPGIGVIGFVPEREAQLLLAQLELEPATSILTGQVDSIRDNNVDVTLCLWK